MTIKRFDIELNPDEYCIRMETVDDTEGAYTDADTAQELYDAAVELLKWLDADKDVITKDWWVSERNRLATAIIKIRGE